MPKIKKQRYHRVKELHNVFTPDPHKPDRIYPWEEPRYSGLKTILEIGCGKGEHSLRFAEEKPSFLCIGVDIKSHRLCVGAEKAIARGIDNLFFLRARVEELTHFFPDQSIYEIWMTFPDPHPKQRGIKHRLSSAGFLNQYARLLKPGGKLHLKTDSRLFYDYTCESIEYWGGRIVVDSNDLHNEDESIAGRARQITSTFEKKALAKGKTIKYLAFTLN